MDLREQLQSTLGTAYVLERELGGGMSRVFLARETALGRLVVIKVLLPELAAGVSMDRFRREVQVAARLQHPHIVPLLATGEACGLPYFTMPFVSGESLRARLLRDGELPVPDTIRILRDVASALAYAHAQGVVHRDIKPDNVLLAHGVAVVTDFGVAKAVTASSKQHAIPQATGLTSLGLALGTPGYMAPEQASADPAMDHRVDIYAFGIMAYEMLAGEPPFAGRSPQALLAAHVSVLPESITARRPGIPPALAALVMKCLEKRPADRPQTASDLMAALDALTTPSGGTMPVRSVRLRRWRAAASKAAHRFGLPALSLALFIGAGLWTWVAQRDTPRESGEEAGATSSLSIGAESVGAESVVPETPAAAPTAPVVPRAKPDPDPEPEPPPEPARPARPRADTPARVAEDSVLLARLRDEANGARARAVAAGVDESLLARGDTALILADSLEQQRRTAAAAAQLSSATTTWASGADAARARAAADSARTAAAAERAVATRRAVPRAAVAESVVAPPTPPRPAPNPESEIRTLFREYAAAIEAQSVERIRRVYPGLLPVQARGWEEFFRTVGEIRTELDVTGLQITGDAAQARLAGLYIFSNPSVHRTQRESVSFLAFLRRAGGRWRIDSLR